MRDRLRLRLVQAGGLTAVLIFAVVILSLVNQSFGMVAYAPPSETTGLAARIVRTWTLSETLLSRESILAWQEIENHGGSVEFRAWLSPAILVRSQTTQADTSGILVALSGSMVTVLLAAVFSIPLGIGAGIYLAQYAAPNWFSRTLKTAVEHMAGLPPILFGLLGLSLFSRILPGQPVFARSVLSASLTLALYLLPGVIQSTQEGLRSVPDRVWHASFALGAGRWQTIRDRILPLGRPGLVSGVFASLVRILGDAAALLVIGVASFVSRPPTSLLSPVTTLPVQIYQWSVRGQTGFRNAAAAAIVVLVVLIILIRFAAGKLSMTSTEKLGGPHRDN